MKTRTKVLIGVSAAAVVAVGLAGAGYAHRPWGGHGGGHGMMGMGPEAILGQFDADNDGKLTQAEIDQARTERFARYDADGNGILSLDEFGNLFHEVIQPMTVRAFQMLDPDGDGSVTTAEFDQPFTNLVQRFDRNGDGALSPEDRPKRWHGKRGHHRDGDRDDD